MYACFQILSDSSTDISVVVFYSFNSLDGNSNHPAATMEYLMQCNKSGMPPRLKKNCICTMTNNLDINAGLVKNRRVIVHDIHRNFVMFGANRGPRPSADGLAAIHSPFTDHARYTVILPTPQIDV